MTKNMLEILENIDDDNVRKEINNLIKSNILTVKDVVNASIESKDPSIILSVATYVNSLNSEDIEKLADAIIATKNAACIYLFACDVKDAPIEKLADAIITAKNPFYIYNFAAVKGAPIAKLADAICVTNDAYYIYFFALYIKGAPIEKLADAIIATKNAQYIYRFARDVKGAPIEKLAEGIIATKDAKKAMAELIELANNGDLKTIESGADRYRTLLLGTEAEVQEKSKTKVRKPEKQ